MKRKIILIIASVIAIMLLGAGCDSSGSDSSNSVTYNLRDRGPAGGWVFYDKGYYSDGWRYMEAWEADESVNYIWETSPTAVTGCTSTDIGEGYNNTYNCMTGSDHPAAQEARDAEYGGYYDWFLPSIDELEQIHENLYNDGENVGNFTLGSAHYWSSSELNKDNAFATRIQSGSTGTIALKDAAPLYVRVVRAF